MRADGLTMVLYRRLVLVFIALCICSIPTVAAYFGLAARKPILIGNLGMHPSMLGTVREDASSAKLCDMMLLQRKQRKMCRRDKGISSTLVEAMNLATLECERQFKHDRWNCSLEDQYRLNLLKKGFKETSFLYAISSASLVYTFARACSRAAIDRCTCDESKTLKNREAWMWGGCGHNIKFGLKFSRRFLRAGKRRSGKDVRAKVDQHNIRLGRKVVKSVLTTKCKCHGISGSCTVRSCWRELSTFPSIGDLLKTKYEQSYKVVTYTNQATGKSHSISEEVVLENNYGNYVSPWKNSVSENSSRQNNRNRKNGNNRKSRRNSRKERNSARFGKESGEIAPKADVMVHLEDSPTFCEPSPYSRGTHGQVCDHSNCDVMCCGRGYNIRSVTVRSACQCQVLWCCRVECKQCITEEEMYLCK